MKKISKVLIVLTAAMFFVLGWRFWYIENDEPPVLTANFIDLDQVEKISVFRSCQGHTVVPQDESESRRNMKHYVWLKPEYRNGKVAIYTPLDGRINGIMEMPEEGLEGEISLGLRGNDWNFSIQHINILSDLKEGQRIKAGDLLGYISADDFDIVYSTSGKMTGKKIDGWNSPYGALDSPFNHMSKELLAEYAARGVTLDNIILSKEVRDQNPCRYESGGQAAQLNGQDHLDDWVYVK